MKLLLDTCISWTVRDALQAAGHDVIWTGDWPKDPGDEEILEYGYRENRILITLDKDFGELAVVRGQAHAGIIRLVNWSSRQQVVTCRMLIEHYGTELESGAIITAEPGRVRIIDPQVIPHKKEMADQSNQLVQKLWNYCNVLRDAGMSYGDYVEQLTYLLFLKMADERTKAPYSEPSAENRISIVEELSDQSQ